ncbi:hypothetical protein [Streptomyces glomeratus]|uniref:hypothetical protein n=1 Tax=Streptomyces glomeratus TaxID=284452 RepID=UPI001F1C67A8|nr:hypothetical protein [Streptomyces glomeratus]MCF1512725.1 hypothetical protein [Streptomyces glomeratus]
MARTAGQEAAAVGNQATQAVEEVTRTAVEQARTVAGEARAQAGDVARDLRSRMVEEAESQVRRGAGTMRQWAGELAEIADTAAGDSSVKSVLSEASRRGRHAAQYIEERGAEGLVSDVQDFARRRPGLFLGGALLAGFTVGRLAKAGSRASAGVTGGSPTPPQSSARQSGQSPAGQPEIPDYPYDPSATDTPTTPPRPEL